MRSLAIILLFLFPTFLAGCATTTRRSTITVGVDGHPEEIRDAQNVTVRVTYKIEF